MKRIDDREGGIATALEKREISLQHSLTDFAFVLKEEAGRL